MEGAGTIICRPGPFSGRLMKVLLVEDNAQVTQFVRRGLEEDGHTVDHADNGRDGLFMASTGQYDIMILDRMLPGGIDGLAIVDSLRKTGNKTPILILSALAAVDDRIRGLKAGGDDYLTKPFAFGELSARLDALIRRSQGVGVRTELAVADLRLDLLTRKVTPNSHAAESGVQAGDVIVRVGSDTVKTPAEAAAKIHAAQKAKKDAVPLLVSRDGTTYYLALQLVNS